MQRETRGREDADARLVMYWVSFLWSGFHSSLSALAQTTYVRSTAIRSPRLKFAHPDLFRWVDAHCGHRRTSPDTAQLGARLHISHTQINIVRLGANGVSHAEYNHTS